MTRVAPICLCAVLVACRAPPEAVAFARDQVVFAAAEPEPVALLLVVQRTREGDRNILEVKGFVANGGRLRSLLYERVDLPAWPADLAAALAAWQRHRSGLPLRIEAAFAGGLRLTVRQPNGGFTLALTDPQPAVTTQDPHETARQVPALATLEVNGRRWTGRAVHETLAPKAVAWPRFGRFEMWLLARNDGALVLGRCSLDAEGARGRALTWAGERATQGPFSLAVLDQRRDAATGFDLPSAWRLGDLGTMARTDGAIGRGQAPGGGPAVYDAAVAQGPGGLALVMHLQDR